MPKRSSRAIVGVMVPKLHARRIPPGSVRKTLRIALAVATVAAILVAAILLPGRIRARRGPAELWTDNPGILAAAELFNASQDRHLVIVRWKDNLADALLTAPDLPSVAVGRNLRSQILAPRFRDLGAFLDSTAIRRDAFYPSLLASGSFGNEQILLPLSFDLDLLAFSGDATIRQPATINGETLRRAAKAWTSTPISRQATAAAPDRMAFSFRWNTDFLVSWIDAAGANFREPSAERRESSSVDMASIPLTWDEVGLAAAIESVRALTADTSGSVAAEDEFSFKYMVAPPYRHAEEGRILFAPMDAASYFLLDGNIRRKLDFGWAGEKDSLRIKDDACWVGLPEASSGRAAADAFLLWLFQPENQKALLEASDLDRSSESTFGVAGGFSALVAVTEGVFPRRHPELVGKLPSAKALRVGEPLPPRWKEFSSAVIGPWLAEAVASPANSGIDAAALAARIAEYIDRNPEPLP